MTRTVVMSAARTPIGKFGGSLRELKAIDLGARVIREACFRAGVVDELIDEVVMGMALQAGAGQIPSRQAACKAGLPWEIATETINKVCASGLRAVTLGDQIIRAGDAQVVVAGGMESMSNVPHAMTNARWGIRMGHGEMLDLMLHDGLTCAFHQVPMAVHGSHVAREYGITREEQDRWAIRSHERAIQAMENGKLAEEVVPVAVRDNTGGTRMVDVDEGPRSDTNLEKLSKLAPVYDRKGSITAGNAPGVNDGAGALLLMSDTKAKELGQQPLATILGHAEVGQEAQYIATTPGLAINKLLKQTGYSVTDIDLFEVNEAFSAVVLISEKIALWDPEKVNVNGGAIAFGHPIGASGARILTTLIYELRRRGGGLGVAAICSGAAQGDAILVEVVGT